MKHFNIEQNEYNEKRFPQHYCMVYFLGGIPEIHIVFISLMIIELYALFSDRLHERPRIITQ